MPEFRSLSPSLNDADRRTLKGLVEEIACDGMRVMEIGSWTGASALILVEVAKQHNGSLVCVDTWASDQEAGEHCENVFAVFCENMRIGEVEEIVCPLRMTSDEALAFLRNKAKFNLIFIDGDHSYEQAYKDIVGSLFLIKKDGILCGHDRKHPGVARALREVLGNSHTDADSSFWVARWDLIRSTREKYDK